MLDNIAWSTGDCCPIIEVMVCGGTQTTGSQSHRNSMPHYLILCFVVQIFNWHSIPKFLLECLPGWQSLEAKHCNSESLAGLTVVQIRSHQFQVLVLDFKGRSAVKAIFLHLQLLSFVVAIVWCPIPSFAGVRGQLWPLSDPWTTVMATSSHTQQIQGQPPDCPPLTVAPEQLSWKDSWAVSSGSHFWRPSPELVCPTFNFVST